MILQAALLVVAGEDLGGAAGGVGSIDDKDDGHEGLREAFPGDEVLMHIVTLGAGGFENEACP